MCLPSHPHIQWGPTFLLKSPGSGWRAPCQAAHTLVVPKSPEMTKPRPKSHSKGVTSPELGAGQALNSPVIREVSNRHQYGEVFTHALSEHPQSTTGTLVPI